MNRGVSVEEIEGVFRTPWFPKIQISADQLGQRVREIRPGCISDGSRFFAFQLLKNNPVEHGRCSRYSSPPTDPMGERKLTLALAQAAVAFELAITHIFAAMRDHGAQSKLRSLVILCVDGHANRAYELRGVNMFFALAFEMSNDQYTSHDSMDDLFPIRKLMNFSGADPTRTHIPSLDSLGQS